MSSSLTHPVSLAATLVLATISYIAYKKIHAVKQQANSEVKQQANSEVVLKRREDIKLGEGSEQQGVKELR